MVPKLKMVTPNHVKHKPIGSYALPLVQNVEECQPMQQMNASNMASFLRVC